MGGRVPNARAETATFEKKCHVSLAFACSLNDYEREEREYSSTHLESLYPARQNERVKESKSGKEPFDALSLRDL